MSFKLKFERLESRENPSGVDAVPPSDPTPPPTDPTPPVAGPQQPGTADPIPTTVPY